MYIYNIFIYITHTHIYIYICCMYIYIYEQRSPHSSPPSQMVPYPPVAWVPNNNMPTEAVFVQCKWLMG